jgi:hypothetical protein
MASKISDPQYVTRILEEMEGKPNRMKAEKIVYLYGGRIRQRIRDEERILQKNTTAKP